MKLKELLPQEEILETYLADEEIEVKGITDNSKKVYPSYLFFARKGVFQDGESFIPEAIEKGACCIVRESPPDKALKIPQIRVKNLRKALGDAVLNFYGRPEKKLHLIGITGTNGKSSTSYFLKCLLDALGYKTGYIGTLFYDVGERKEAKETTPSILEVAPLLKEARHKGFKFVVMEVSSHALSQDRLLPLKFDLAGFTNLSRDHLDYHRDMEEYYQAKKKLFTHYLKEKGKAVISFESPYGKRLYEELKQERGLTEEALLAVNDGKIRVKILEREGGLKLRIKALKGEYEVKTELFGDYQALNVGTLVGCALFLGLEEEKIISALRELRNPPGRLELCGIYNSAYIFVDYAHTPEALQKAIESLKPLCKGRLITLFGCGGNRDPGKRPLMGKIASELSDLVILTSDNPRFEDPLKIIEEIKLGLNGKTPYFEIPDRREALLFAIKNLRPGDCLLVAGKGHETYQEIKGVRYPFSDREEVKKIIRSLKENAN